MKTAERSPVDRRAGAVRVELRSPLPNGVLVAGHDPIRLSWRIRDESDDQQVAYEIQASRTADFRDPSWGTGEIASAAQVAMTAPGPALRSREVRHLRVRVRTSSGWSDWCRPVRVEAGLLEARDWVAQAITLPNDPGAERSSPSPLLRREFTVDGAVSSARLHVTALGLHRVTINGRAVSEDLLAPGWTTYGHRLIADTYDVARLLRPGPNVIAAVLGDGWYRGRLGWKLEGDRCHYGSQLGLIAQLEVALADGRTQTVASDGTWLAATGEILAADLYDGSLIDLRLRRIGWDLPGYDTTDWDPAVVVPHAAESIEPRVAPPVRRVAVMPASRTRRDATTTTLDGGQNLAGFVRLTVRGRPGDLVVVRHAEVLELDGSLQTESLRSAKATDTYVLADGEPTVLEPAFTFHGFRYAEVETTAEIIEAEIVAISSDTPPRSRFECSLPILNRLHQNVAWSQRGNFVSVPTDCPQRDERLGWTGDAQAFAPTASTLFDSRSFWQSWLRDLELDQDDELGVSSVVPDAVLDGEMRFGRGGWADAAAIVPWALYESFGDPAPVERQFESMQRWVDSLERRRGADGLLPPGPQFGDWLDPDAPADRPWQSKADPTYLANAFFANSARLVAAAAPIAGRPALAERYRTLADDVSRWTWATWAEHAVSNQTGCAVALRLGIVPVGERARVARALADLVRSADGAVATGFLGTPLVLPALADEGYFDECYLMLLRRDSPSWLYQVERGATTAWERWDAILPDGSIHPGTMAANPIDPESGGGQMSSFNHYAYGAVVDWIYRNLAGLAPDPAKPGYRHVVVAPRPCTEVTWVRASVDSAYGAVAIEWRCEAGGDLLVELDLPFGTSATFVPPRTGESRVSLDGVGHDGDVVVSPGRHTLVVTAPAVADPKAVRSAS